MVLNRIPLLAAAALLSIGCPGLGSQQPPTSGGLPEEPTWEEDIKPIMDIHCNECHSVPPQQAAPGTLRLDTCETVGGIPGAQSQAARIIVRTIDKTPTPMPPANYETTPTADEEEILQRWVDQGAKCDGAAPTNNSMANSTANNTMSDMGGLDAAMDAGPDAADAGVDMVDASDMMDEPEMDPVWTFAEVADYMRMDCSKANCHADGRGNLQFAPDVTDANLIATLMMNSVNAPTDGMPFIDPMDKNNSAVFLRMTSDQAGDVMPADNGGMMDAAAVAEIEAWFDAGAPGFQ